MNCSTSIEKHKEILKSLLKLDSVKYKNFDEVIKFIINGPLTDEQKSVSTHVMSQLFIGLNQRDNSFQLNNALQISEMGSLLNDSVAHLKAVEKLIKPSKKIDNSLNGLMDSIQNVIDSSAVMTMSDYEKEVIAPIESFFTNNVFQSEKEKDNAIASVRASIATLSNKLLPGYKIQLNRRIDEVISNLIKTTPFISITEQLEENPELDTYMVTLKNKEVVEAVKDQSGLYYDIITGMIIDETFINNDNVKKSVKGSSYQRSQEFSDDKISHVFYSNNFGSGLSIVPYSTTESFDDVVSYFDGVTNPVTDVKIFAVKINQFADDRVKRINSIKGLENKTHETFESKAQSDFLMQNPDGEVITLSREKESENNFTLVGEIVLADGTKRNFYIYGLDNYVVLDANNNTTKLDFTNNTDLLKVQELAVNYKNKQYLDLTEFDLQTLKVLAQNFKTFKSTVLPTVNSSTEVAVDVTNEFFNMYSIDKDFKVKSFLSLRDAQKEKSNIFHEVTVSKLDEDGNVINEETRQLPFLFTKDKTKFLTYVAVDFLNKNEVINYEGKLYSFEEYLEAIGINDNLVQELVKDAKASYVNSVYVVKNKDGKLSYRIGKFMEHLSNEVLFSKFVSDIVNVLEGPNAFRAFDRFFEEYSFKSRKTEKGKYTLNINFTTSFKGELQVDFRPVKGFADYDFINANKKDYNFSLGENVMQNLLKSMMPSFEEYKELQNKYPFFKSIALYDANGEIIYESFPLFVSTLFDNTIVTSSPELEKIVTNIKNAQDKFNDIITEKIVNVINDLSNSKYNLFKEKLDEDFGGIEEVLFNKQDSKFKMPRVKFGKNQVANVERQIEEGVLNTTFDNYGVVNSNSKKLQINLNNNSKPLTSEQENINAQLPVTNNVEIVTEPLTAAQTKIYPVQEAPEQTQAFGKDEFENPDNLEDDVPFKVLEEDQALKLATTDEKFIEDTWFASTYLEMFPLASLEEIQDIIELTKLDGSVLGAVKDRVIYLNENLRTKGVLYHESFHAVFRYLMNDTIRRQLLDAVIGNKKYKNLFSKDAIAKFASDRNLVESDERIIDLIAEEILADGFMDYMEKEQTPKTMLQRFFEFLKNIIKYFNKNAKFIDAQYKNIRKGYTNSVVKESELFNNEIAFLSIPGLIKNTVDPNTGAVKAVKTTLVSKEKNELIDSVLFEIFNDNSTKDFDEKFDQAAVNLLNVWNFDRIYNQIPETEVDKRKQFKKEYYQKLSNYRFVLGGRMHKYLNKDGEIQSLPMIESLSKDNSKELKKLENITELKVYDINDTDNTAYDNKLYKNSHKNSINGLVLDNTLGEVSYNMLKEEVKKKYDHMKNFVDDYEDFTDEESKTLENLKMLLETGELNPQNEFQDEYDDNEKNPYQDKSLSEKGSGLDSLPKELRQAFSIIRYDYLDPEYGIKVPKHVDGYERFGALIKISAGKNVDEIIENIKIYSDQLRDDNIYLKEADDFLHIYNFLKEKCGISEDEYGYVTVKNPQFYNMVVDTLMKVAADYVVITTNMKINNSLNDFYDDGDSFESSSTPVVTSSMNKFDIRDKILSDDIGLKKSELLRNIVSTYNKKRNTTDYKKSLEKIRALAKKFGTDSQKNIFSSVSVNEATEKKSISNNDTNAEKWADELSKEFKNIGFNLPKSLIRMSLIAIDILENNNNPKFKRGSKILKHYYANESFVNEGQYLQKDFFLDLPQLIDQLYEGEITGSELTNELDDAEGMFKRLGLIVKKAASYVVTYDPTGLPSVFRNAEGKPTYRYISYTPIFHIAEEIRQKGLLESFINDTYYENIKEYLNANPYFKDLLSGKNNASSRQMQLFFDNFRITLYGGVEQKVDDARVDANVFKNLDDTSQHILSLVSFLKRKTYNGKINREDTSVETYSRMYTTIESTNTNYLMPAIYEQYFTGDGVVKDKDGFEKATNKLLSKVEQEFERIKAEYARVKESKKEFDSNKRLTKSKLILKYNAVLAEDNTANIDDKNLRAFKFNYLPEFWKQNSTLMNKLINAAKSQKNFNGLSESLIQELKEELEAYSKYELDKYIALLQAKDVIKEDPETPGQFTSSRLPIDLQKDTVKVELRNLYGKEDIYKNIQYDVRNMISDAFYNNWINGLFINDVFDGDIAIGVKNATDYFKRQKRNAASGSNMKVGEHKVAYGNTITAYIHPEYLGFGPYYSFEEIEKDPKLIGNEDIKAILKKDYNKKVNINGVDVDTVQNMFDGQSVSSLMHQADIYETIGRLNTRVLELLIKKHYMPLNASEIKELKKQKVVFNSKKTVTASRNLYHKLSEVHIDRSDVSMLVIPNDPDYQDWTIDDARDHLHKLYSKIYQLRTENKYLVNKGDVSKRLSTENSIKEIAKEIHRFFIPLPHRRKLHDLLNSMEYHSIDQFMDTEASKLATSLPTDLNYKDENGYIQLERSSIYSPNKYKFWQVETSGIKTMIKYSVQSKALLPANLKDVTSIIEKKGISLTEEEKEAITNEMNDLLFDYHSTLTDVAKSHEALMNTFFGNEDVETNIGFMFNLIRKNLAEQGVTSNKLKFFETDEVTGKPVHNLNLPSIRSMFQYYFFSQYSNFTDEKGTGEKYIHMSSYGYDVLIDKNGNTVFTKDYQDDPLNPTYENISSRPLGVSLEKKNGKNIYYVECIVPKPLYDNPKLLAKYKDELLKMIGVRVPTEDKRSMVALKVVDYIDSSNLSGIIVPQLVHMLAGSDLDVDTLYTQQYSFYNNFNNTPVLYGDYKDYDNQNQGEFIEYLNYLSTNRDIKPLVEAEDFKIRSKASIKNSKEVLKVMSALKYNTEEFDIETAFELLSSEKLSKIDIDLINEEIYSLKESVKLSGVYSTRLKKLYEEKQKYYFIKNNIHYADTYIKVLSVMNVLKDLKLPATQNTFDKTPLASLLVKNKFQNLHLNAKLNIMSNSNVFNNLFINERSSTQAFKDILKTFGISLESNDDAFTTTGIINARTKNVLSKLGIGVTANINKTLAFLSQYFDDDLNANLKDVIWTYRSSVEDEEATSFSKIAGFNVDDQRTIAIIGNILGMFADGAKDPIPAALRLNEVNTSATLTMLAIGMDPKLALTFNFIPEIVTSVEEVQKTTYAVKDGINLQRTYLSTQLTKRLFELSKKDDDVNFYLNELKNSTLVNKKSSLRNMMINKDKLIINYTPQKLDQAKLESNTLSLMDLGIQVSVRKALDEGEGFIETPLSENAQKIILLYLYKKQSEQVSEITAAGNPVNMFKSLRPDFNFIDKMRSDIKALRSGTSVIEDGVTSRMFESNQVLPVFERILDHLNEKSKMFVERSDSFKPIKNVFEHFFKNKSLFANTITSYVALTKFKNTFIQNEEIYGKLSPANKQIADATTFMIKEMFKADYWFNNNLKEELTQMQEKHPDNSFLSTLRVFESNNTASTKDNKVQKETFITLVGSAKISNSVLQQMEEDASLLAVEEPLFFRRLFIHELVRTGLTHSSGSFLNILDADNQIKLSKNIEDFVNILSNSKDAMSLENNLKTYLNTVSQEDVFEFMKDMFANVVYAASNEVENYKILEPVSERRTFSINESQDYIAKLDFSNLDNPVSDPFEELMSYILPVPDSYSLYSGKYLTLNSDNDSDNFVFNFNIPGLSYGNIKETNMIDIANKFGIDYHKESKGFIFPAAIKIEGVFYLLQGVDEKMYNEIGENLLHAKSKDEKLEFVTDYNTGRMALYKKLPVPPKGSAISYTALSINELNKYNMLLEGTATIGSKTLKSATTNYEQLQEISNYKNKVSQNTSFVAESVGETIYKELGDKTKSKNVELPQSLGLKYHGKNFWNELVPEARGMWENPSHPIIIAYRGNKSKTFFENYRSNTIGNPFDFRNEEGTRKEQGVKSTVKFINWIITGENYGEENATEEYREALIQDFKSGYWKNAVIFYYEEKGYATHATALDYLINEYNWNEPTQVTKQPKGIEIKPGVEELFESNSELANGVYEALGFKEKLSSITPKVSITNYRTMDDKSKKDAIDGVEEAQRRWVEEEIAEFYEAVHQYNNNLDTFSSKGVNKGKATIDDVIDETLGIFRTIQMFPKFSDLILPYIDDIQIAIDSFGRKEGYAIYKAKKDKKGQAKEMTYENLFEVVDKYMKPFQITPQQKQQALQLYSQYLDTIFPDSKVKDIVYHGSNQKIEQFEVRKEPLIHFGTKSAALQRGNVLNQTILNIKDLETIKDGMWFLGTDEGGLLKELLDRNILTIEEVKSINEVKNKAVQQSPYFHENYRMAIPAGEKAGNQKLQEILKNKNIGFEYVNESEDKGSVSYAVPSQEQIHILGNEQDVKGFKNFVSAQPSTQPTSRKTYSGKVTSLKPNQIFVFGSNPEGRHGAGAAKYAKDNFGAIYGQGEGLQGQSYALPTKDLRIKTDNSLRSISSEEITNNIRKLYEVAKQNPNKEFLVSDYSESNLNGYTGQEMADMFIAAGPIPSNIIFNQNFDKLIISQPAVEPIKEVKPVVKKVKKDLSYGETQLDLFAEQEKEVVTSTPLENFSDIESESGFTNVNLNKYKRNKPSIPDTDETC